MLNNLDDFLARAKSYRNDPDIQAALATEYELSVQFISEYESLSSAFNIAAILRWFDVAVLSYMLSVPTTEAEHIIARLASLSSIEGFRRGEWVVYNVHESTRRGWRRMLAADQREHFMRLSSRAAEYFSDASDASRIERFYHLASSDPDQAAVALEDMNWAWMANTQCSSHALLSAALRELVIGEALRPALQAEILLYLGKLGVECGETSEIEKIARRALAFARSAGRPSAEARAQQLLGHALSALGRMDEGLTALRSSEAIHLDLTARNVDSETWKLNINVVQREIDELLIKLDRPPGRATKSGGRLSASAEGKAAKRTGEQAHGIDLEATIRPLLAAGHTDEATSVVVRQLGPEVLGFLSGVIGDADADEVFSRWSERLWRSLGKFEGRCSIRTWAYVLARQEIMRFRRETRKHADRRVPLSELEDVIADVRSDSRSEIMTARQQQLIALRNQLPIEDRTLLILRVDRNLSFDEIALAFADNPEAFDAVDRHRGAARLRKQFQIVKLQLAARLREVGEVG